MRRFRLYCSLCPRCKHFEGQDWYLLLTLNSIPRARSMRMRVHYPQRLKL